MRLPLPATATMSASTLALALLSACGGGAADAPAPAPPPQTPPAATLAGTVAVGAPITSGTLRVLDADGNVVAHDVPIGADGSYAGVTLTGNGPWRVEACGYAGANYGCIYAVARAAGTANVTPITSALVALASGAAPGAMMAGGGAPTAGQLDAAQAQLQAGLAGTLQDAGVAGDFDFTTGTLAAGSRSGYDRVLDAVAVTTGIDGGAFVQMQPRLGDGNLYLTPGSTTGTITTAAGAASLPLGGVETLFRHVSAAMASASACADPAAGLATDLASDARISMGGGRASGRSQVAAAMCQYFAGGDDGATPIWGSRIVSPVLGRCDFSGADPICAVSFALQDPEGDVQNVGDGMAVVYRGGAWQFYGDLLPIEIHANAAVQRNVRVDDATTPVTYSRALQFDIANTPGVACAQISQRDAAGTSTTIAYYKPWSADTPRLSLWLAAGNSGNTPSLDPAQGALQGSDSTWIGLPDGTAGDEVVRNFFRAGRSVTVSIFSDAACTTPAVLDGRSDFQVDVQGVPPVWAEMGRLGWGTLSAATTSALESLTLAAGTGGSLDAAWSFDDAVTGFGQATVCTSGDCAEHSPVRIGDTSVRPGHLSVTVPLAGPAAAVGAGDFKLLALGGRDGDGMNVESVFISCSALPAGQPCR
jgi:hypothetical protein